jgi:hypothetical protein
VNCGTESAWIASEALFKRNDGPERLEATGNEADVGAAEEPEQDRNDDHTCSTCGGHPSKADDASAGGGNNEHIEHAQLIRHEVG